MLHPKILFFFLCFTLSSSLHLSYGESPSFDCKKAKAGIEKDICNCGTLSRYDAVLAYLYQSLRLLLPTQERDTLKKEQITWLLNDRLIAYKKDIKSRKQYEYNALHSKYNDPNAYIDRLTASYGDRVTYYLTHHQNLLEPFFYDQLGKYSNEEDIFWPFKCAFFWHLFVNYYAKSKLIYDPERVDSYRYFDSEEDMRMVRISDHEWLVVFRGNRILQITNGDGGMLSFWIIDHALKTTKLIQVEENYSQKSNNFIDHIQAYPITVTKDNIVVGNGNHFEPDKKPRAIYYYRLNDAHTRLELVSCDVNPDK